MLIKKKKKSAVAKTVPRIYQTVSLSSREYEAMSFPSFRASGCGQMTASYEGRSASRHTHASPKLGPTPSLQHVIPLFLTFCDTNGKLHLSWERAAHVSFLARKLCTGLYVNRKPKKTASIG